MTPQEARAWTLKEVSDFAKKEQIYYEGEVYEIHGEKRQDISPEYHALQSIIDFCEQQLKKISY